MTLEEYIANPSGKGVSVMGNKKVIQDMYQDRYSKVMAREGGKLNAKLYVEGSNFIAHFKIPSEVVENLYYDVVIRFKKPLGLQIIKNLFEYDIEVFSNDPAFVFTYANAFIKKRLFFNTLISKLTREAATKPAKVKNPDSTIGYVKTLYFAYLFMKYHNLHNPSNWIALDTYDKNHLLNSVTSADAKIKQRIDKLPDKGKSRTNARKSLENNTKRTPVKVGNITSSKARGAFARKARAVDRAKTGGIVRTTAFAKRVKRVK